MPKNRVRDTYDKAGREGQFTSVTEASFAGSPSADERRIKYSVNDDRVVGFYKKMLTDLRSTIQNERKQVRKYLRD